MIVKSLCQLIGFGLRKKQQTKTIIGKILDLSNGNYLNVPRKQGGMN